MDMEDNEIVPYTTEEQADLKEPLCVSCKLEQPLDGNPNLLCSNCRQNFINYPIPRWIWAFGAGVLIVMSIAAFRMPAYLSAAIHLAKAEKAMDQKLFWTAQKELRQMEYLVPDNLIMNSKLFISACYNHDLLVLEQAYSKIVDKKFEDDELYNEVEKAFAFVNNSFPADTIIPKKVELYRFNKDSLSKLSVDLFQAGGQDMISGQTVIANALYDLADYDASDKILERVLTMDSNNYTALSLLSAVKRNKGQYDKAISFCDKMLDLNREDVMALNQKARVELKRHKDNEALKYAQQAMAIDPNHLFSMEAKAMTDYFFGRKSESIKLLAKIKQGESFQGDSSISRRLEPILNGSVKYR